MKKPSWKLRRRAVFGSLIFAAGVISYVLFRWDDTALAQTVVLSAFGLIGAIVASYIGGAVYEDTHTPQIIQPTTNDEEQGYPYMEEE
jgi:uncharacterized membrane protein